MKEQYITLIQTTVDGLIHQGYREVGGSDCFRILRFFKPCEDLDGGEVLSNEVKVYLDDYNRPQSIVVRYAFHEDEVEA